MLKLLYKYNHPIHGTIHLSVAGKSCSFFSIKSQQQYGKEFTYNNYDDLVDKINTKFHYHKNDFTLEKEMKYISGDVDDNKKMIKKYKVEHLDEERIPFVPLMDIVNTLTNKEILSLMSTSKLMYNMVYLIVKNRFFINVSLFLNEVVIINKSDVEKLNIDVTLTTEEEKTILKEFTKLRVVKMKINELGLYGDVLTQVEELILVPYKKFTKKENPIVKVNLSHIPPRVNSLTIHDMHEHKKSIPNGSVSFIGTLKAQGLKKFTCAQKIVGKFPDLGKIEYVNMRSRYKSYTLPDTVVEATFGFYCRGPLVLPTSLKKFKGSINYDARVFPLPDSLESFSFTYKDEELLFEIFETSNIGTILERMPKSLTTLKLKIYGTAVFNGTIEKMPPNLKRMDLALQSNVIDFKKVVYPDSLTDLAFTLDGYNEKITRWPAKLRKLSIFLSNEEEDNRAEIENLPNSLEEIEFPFDHIHKVIWPKNLKTLISTEYTPHGNELPNSIEFLKIREVNHPDTVFPNKLTTLYYDLIRTKDIYFPKSVKTLTLEYPVWFTKENEIVIKNLPDDLEDFSFYPRNDNYTIEYSEQNHKNIKVMMLENGVLPEAIAKPYKVKIPKGTIPRGIERLEIRNSHNYYYQGIDLFFYDEVTHEVTNEVTREVTKKVTNEVTHPSLKIVRVERHNEKKTIFLLGTLTIPVFYYGTLDNLAPEVVKRIEFESGSRYSAYFDPPPFLEYIRLPKYYTWLDKWVEGNLVDGVVVEFNSE